jgi:hypothetical protein
MEQQKQNRLRIEINLGSSFSLKNYINMYVPVDDEKCT